MASRSRAIASLARCLVAFRCCCCDCYAVLPSFSRVAYRVPTTASTGHGCVAFLIQLLDATFPKRARACE